MFWLMLELGVPGHDTRDLEVSKTMGFLIKQVVKEGVLINSGQYDGMLNQG